MEKQIKKLVELAHQIFSDVIANEISVSGWRYYTDSIYVYLSLDGNCNRAVQFKRDNAEIMQVNDWSSMITIDIRETAESLSKLHDAIKAEWDDFMTTKADEMKQRAIEERKQRIAYLQRELEELTSK